MAPTDKQNNVIVLISSLAKLSQGMPDGKLKDDFKGFIYQLTVGSKSLIEILDMIQKKIDIASSVQHNDMKVNAKSTVSFWTTIRNMLMDTYKENKGE